MKNTSTEKKAKKIIQIIDNTIKKLKMQYRNYKIQKIKHRGKNKTKI